jgi:outer membrane protein
MALVLASASPVWATQPLQDFLQRAQMQNFDVRESNATERQRGSEADAALGRLTPAVSARGQYTRNQAEVSAVFPGTNKPIVISPQDQLDAVFQLDVPIVDLANYHRYKSAKSIAKSASEQRDATFIDASRSVSRAYYTFLGASALVDSAQRSIAAAQDNLKLVSERRGAGAATELDYERAASSVARAQQDLADAELGVSLAGRALATLSGLEPQPTLEYPAEDDLHSEGPLQNWLARAGDTPAVRAAQHQHEAVQQNRKAAGRALLPTLAGSAQERMSNATGFAGRANSYQLQLVLGWRLDYGLIATTDAQDAALDAQSVRLERSRRAAEDATFEAFQRVTNGIAKSRASRVEAQSASRAAELALTRYDAGVATQLDVTQAQRDAFLASAARIQSDAELAYARAALRLAVGERISGSGASTTMAPAASETNQ